MLLPCPGCVHCVYDVYQSDLEDYRAAFESARAQLKDKHMRLASFDWPTQLLGPIDAEPAAVSATAQAEEAANPSMSAFMLLEQRLKQKAGN